MYLNSCHLDKQKVSRKINWFLFFSFFTVFESSPDDFSRLLWYSTFQMAACPGLTQLLVLTLPPKKYSFCHLSATEPQSPQKVTQWSEWLEMFRVEITYFSLCTAKSDQPRSDLGCVMWVLLFLCIQDLKESWRCGGCKSFGIFGIPSPFLCGCLTAGQLRQGHPSSALSGLCLLHVGLNGKVSLGFSWAIWGSYWPQFSLV